MNMKSSQCNAISGSFNNTVTFTPTVLGEFRYGYSKSTYNRLPVSGSVDPAKQGFDSTFSTQAGLEGKMFPHFGLGGNDGFSDLGPWVTKQLVWPPLRAPRASMLATNFRVRSSIPIAPRIRFSGMGTSSSRPRSASKSNRDTSPTKVSS